MRRSRTVFIDLLFLLVLVMLVTMIVKKPILKSEIERPAEFLIELTWDNDSASDIDLWFREPGGNRISFQQKQHSVYSLDRDDLGQTNDTVRLPDGSIRLIRLNHEILTMRGWVAGIYTVNVFAYTAREAEIPTRIVWYRLNPFEILIEREILLTEKGQEVTAVSLTLNKAGDVTDMNFDPASARPRRNSNSYLGVFSVVYCM